MRDVFTRHDPEDIKKAGTELTDAVLLQDSVEEGWQQAAGSLCRFAGASGCAIWLYSGSEDLLRLVADSDESGGNASPRPPEKAERSSMRRGWPRCLPSARLFSFPRDAAEVYLLCPLTDAEGNSTGLARFRFSSDRENVAYPGQTAALSRVAGISVAQLAELRVTVESAKRIVSSLRRML